jgi:hypothetical protein
MDNYENWRKGIREEKKKRFKGVLALLVFIIPFGILIYLETSGQSQAEEMGVGWYILFFLLCLGEIFMIRNWRALPSANIESYKALEKQVLEQQGLEEKIIKDREEWQRNKEDKILTEIKESLKTEFAQLDLLEKNTQALKKLNCPNPSHLKDTLRTLEAEISEKCGVEVLKKFLRIEKFLEEVRNEINFNIRGITKTVDISSYKESLITDKKKELSNDASRNYERLKNINEGNGRGSDAQLIHKLLVKLSHEMVPGIEKEIQQLSYLDAIAASMVIFSLNNKNILYLEILEAFDKLGALNSTWQKAMENKMNIISNQLAVLAGGLLQLNSNFEKLLDQNDMILGAIKELDGSVKMGNALQAITAYQVYRVNKNLKAKT